MYKVLLKPGPTFVTSGACGPAVRECRSYRATDYGYDPFSTL